MLVRRAIQSDSQILSELIFASGGQSLAAMFDIAPQFNSQGFLRRALCQGGGQFGFANHWVGELDGAVVACISAWHTELGNAFHQVSLQSVIQYYGTEHSMKVLSRSMVVQDFIPKPQRHQLCIGHLAVLPTYQRQGFATYLLNDMSEKAKALGKSEITLDVPVSNHQAIQFYQSLGFTLRQRSIESDAMKALGFAQHLHLFKSI